MAKVINIATRAGRLMSPEETADIFGDIYPSLSGRYAHHLFVCGDVGVQSRLFIDVGPYLWEADSAKVDREMSDAWEGKPSFSAYQITTMPEGTARIWPKCGRVAA